jgi:predicted RNA-binding Zn ribbon-like protein
METGTEAPRELLVVGGDLALDFANTVDDPYGPRRFDHLATYERLLDWCARLGVATPDQAAGLRRRSARHPAEAAEALATAHRLREAVADVFGRVADGGAWHAGWSPLRPHVAEAFASAEVGAEGTLTWPGADRLEAVLHPVAVAAVDLLRSPETTRVKRCGGCPWLFVDRSRNGRRRWCAMSDCGTQEKMRRYVARRAERRTTRP